MSRDLVARRAIEALRAGVPNDSAVQALEAGEPALHAAFRERLTQASAAGRFSATRGLIVAGGFGAGKSHLLGRLALQAMAENFIVSTVSISKETPLHDLRKVYVAAIRNARAPGISDEAIRAVLERLDSAGPAFAALEQWVGADRPVAPVFAAILHLLGKAGSQAELRRRFERFLAGGKLNRALLRQHLAEAGARGLFDLKFTEAGLTHDLVRIAPRLMRAAGFRGWCVLFDEVELIGRYTPLQRGKAYAELARWLGLDRQTAVEGVVAVAAITDDFAAEVVIRKGDDRLLEDRLRTRGLTGEADRAALVMKALRDDAVLLRAPGEAELQAHLQKVRRLYGDAYGWTPPDIPVGSRESSKRMRSFIRAWIAQWDILRLYRESADVETTALATRYTEAPELEDAALDPDEDDV